MILLFRFGKQAAFTYVAKESCLSIQHGSTECAAIKPPCSYFLVAEEGLETRLAHAVPAEWRRNDLLESYNYVRVMCLKEPERSYQKILVSEPSLPLVDF